MYRRWFRASVVLLVLCIFAAQGSASAFAQSFNKLRAINYAWQYASAITPDGKDNSQYNPSYKQFINDCTNFASQCLRAGGWTDVGSSYWDSFSDENWFYEGPNLNLFQRQYTRSWDNAYHLKNFCDNSGRAWQVYDCNAMDPGDIMFADWGGGDGISHTMVVTRRPYGMDDLYLTQHTLNRKDKAWSTYPTTATYYLYHVNTSDKVEYQAHVQDTGWMDPVADGAQAGTTGQSLRMEAIRILAPDRDIVYQAHVQGYGWMDWVSNADMAGTTGQSLRMEAIRIAVNRGHVYYRAHVQNIGWMNWVSDGAVAGTTGQSLRMEAIQIEVTD